MHDRPEEIRPRSGLELLVAAQDALRAREGETPLVLELGAYLARAGTVRPEHSVTTNDGKAIAIQLGGGTHQLRWICGKPGAPRRPRVVCCTRCDTLCYLDDLDEVARTELAGLIEQHGGARCP